MPTIHLTKRNAQRFFFIDDDADDDDADGDIENFLIALFSTWTTTMRA